MKSLRSFMTLGLVLSATAAWAGCSSSTTGSAGDEQDVTGACKVFFVKENRFLTADELSKLNDPVAKKILQGGNGCPSNLSEISAKLALTDGTKCNGAGNGGGGGDAGAGKAPAANPTAGTSTRFVSDRSQVLGVADSYRGVITRECDGRSDHELFISIFGVGTPDQPLPEDAELIGEDKTKGVFDFYAREEGKWKFFGSSIDLVTDGYNCDPKSGACEPKAAAKTRCASCHVGGGLIMKELHSPWVNWEGDTQTPGLDDMFKKHGDILGARGDGIDMESKVTSANHDDWIPKRIELLKTKGVAEVLRPMFCTVDMNLQSGQRSANADFFLDPTWNVFDSISLDATLYSAAIAASKQQITDGRQALKSSKGPVVDTFFAFTFPERGKQDLDYQQALLDAKIIDDDFAKDVLAIDFTRPVYSPTRCGLLQFAPTLDASKMTPDAIRDGFKASLAGKAGAAAELLTSLGNKADAATHTAAAQAFMKACAARPAKDMITDVVARASHLRNVVKTVRSTGGGQAGQGIIEFPETLPTDNLPDADQTFDPATCTLK